MSQEGWGDKESPGAQFEDDEDDDSEEDSQHESSVETPADTDEEVEESGEDSQHESTVESPTDTDEEDEGPGDDSRHGSTVETSTDTDGEETDVDSTIEETSEESDRDQNPVSSPIPIDELDVDRNYSPRMLARSMTPTEYRDDPAGSRVPFAVWRNGVGYGRDRKTFEIQPDIEAVERDVLDKMDKQLGDRPPLTDLREIALVYGLLHWEDLAEMADELGVQYDG